MDKEEDFNDDGLDDIEDDIDSDGNSMDGDHKLLGKRDESQ